MKVNDRSAGRQCYSEGVIEVLGNVFLNAVFVFKNIIFCGINERRIIIIIIFM
jgi:hypothetical protein